MGRFEHVGWYPEVALEFVWTALLVAGVIQGVVIATALLSLPRTRRVRANIVLAALLATITLGVLQYLMIGTGTTRWLPHLTHLPFGYLIPPLYYFYARRLLEPGFRFRPLHTLHLLPAAVELIRRFSYYRLPAERKIAFAEAARTSAHVVDPEVVLPLFAYPIQLAIYVLLVGRLIRRAKEHVVQTCSGSAVSHVMLLGTLNVTFALIVFAQFVVFAYLLAGNEYTVALDFVIVLTACAVIHTIGYAAVMQPDTFRECVVDAPPLPAPPPAVATDHDLYDRLVDFMATAKPHLQRNLRLVDLADRMRVPVRQLSTTINAHFHSNFNDFVNSFRVEEAKRLLLHGDSDTYTLVSIASDAGFTSRATFNRAFKRATGTTPSQYAEDARRAGAGVTPG